MVYVPLGFHLVFLLTLAAELRPLLDPSVYMGHGIISPKRTQ